MFHFLIVGAKLVQTESRAKKKLDFYLLGWGTAWNHQSSLAWNTFNANTAHRSFNKSSNKSKNPKFSAAYMRKRNIPAHNRVSGANENADYQQLPN